MSKVKVCPECSARIQRTVGGTVEDGMAAHFRVVHPGHELAPAPEGEAGVGAGLGALT